MAAPTLPSGNVIIQQITWPESSIRPRVFLENAGLCRRFITLFPLVERLGLGIQVV